MTKEALKLALEALQDFDYDKRMQAITAIKEALAQPDRKLSTQELDAEFNRGYKEGVRDAYARQPQRTWVGLTDEQSHQILMDMARHVEEVCDADATEQQLSAKCIQFILEQVAAHGIKE